jgi:hypothetical protein
MILAYTFSGNSSNNASFLGEDVLPGVICPQCGSCLDYEYSPPFLKINPSKKYDVSYTHDLRNLYSQRFVEFCKEELLSDDVFVPVDVGWGSYYYMMPKRIVAFDWKRRNSTFTDACNLCGSYREIVGAYPACLHLDEPLGPGFYRTDLAFGSGKSKTPLILIGPNWKKLIEMQKFRGATFEATS